MRAEDVIVGNEVWYVRPGQEPEPGIVTSIGTHYIFVRYFNRDKMHDGQHSASKATRAEDLVTPEMYEDMMRWREVYEETS